MVGDLPESGVELVAKNAAAFMAAMEKSTDAMNRFADSVDKDSTQVVKAGGIMEGVFAGVGIAIVDMAAQGAQALGQFVGDSISVAGDFEAGMNSFEVAAGDSLDKAGLKVEEFSDLFLEMGKKLPVSTMDVQEAATTLVKGGLDPLILKAGGLESSLQFAAAAEMDLAEAAELGIKQLATFGDASASAEEQTAFLAEAQNLLVKAAGASTLNVDALGDAMLAAGGQAKASGVDYGDFATTMGLISPAFSSAAEAGTSYKNFLVRLQPTTADATKAMTDLGLLTEDGASKFFDASGAFIGNQAAAELLQNSLTGLSDAERSMALQTIFGNDAMVAASTLADQGAEGYAEFAKAMEGASGVTETAAGKQKGFNTAMDNFMGSVETLQITIGTKLLPILADLFNDYISPGVNYLTSLADAWDTSTDSVETTAPWLAAITDIFADVQAGVQVLAAKYLPMLQGAWEKDLLPAIQEGQRFFAEDLMPILTTVGEIVLPILGTAIEVLAAAWDNILVPAIKIVWSIFSKTLIPILKIALDFLADTLPPAIDFLAGIFTDVLFPAIGFIADGFLGIAEAIGGVIDWLNPLQEGLDGLSVPDVFTPGSPTPFEQGLRGIDSALSDTTPKVDDLGKAMTDLGKSAPGNVAPELDPADVEHFNATFRQLTMTVGAFVDLWSKDLVPGVKWAVGEVGQGVSHLAGVMTTAFDGIRHAVNVAADGFIRLGDAIRNMPPPPPVFTPGSPTPFEEGMWGIDEAMQAVIPDFNKLNLEVGAMNRVTPDAMPGMGGVSNVSTTYNQQRTITMPVYTNNSPAMVEQSMAYYQAMGGGVI